MSNPTFKSGPITFSAAEDVERFRVVSLAADGVSHADGTAPVFGAVTTRAVAESPDGANHIAVAPSTVAVHVAPSVVPVEYDGADPEVGATVYAAADGKVSAAGDVPAGVVVRPAEDGRVKIILVSPVAAAAGGAEGN